MLKSDISKKIVMFLIVLTILSISVFAASIEILSPNGGETYQQELIQINWNGSHDEETTASVKLFYDTDNNKANGRTQIATDLPVNGSLNWSVLGVPNGTYYISGDIITSNFQIGTDYSDNSFDRLYFNKSYTGNTYEVQVGNNTAPDVTIVLPNSSTIVRNQYAIKFYLDSNDKFYRARISYIKNNISHYIESILFSDSNYCKDDGTQINCTYIWDSSALEGYYNLNISITDGTSYNDTISDLFRVSNGPDINITYPNNGESVDYTNITFRWNVTDSLNFNVPYISIYLKPDQSFLNDNTEIVAENIPNNGSYFWNVPIAFPDGDYYVLINATSLGNDSQNNEVNLTSYKFSDQKITLDNARNFTYISNNYEVQVSKNTKPNINITYPSVGKVFSDLITILFNVSDDESDLLTLNIYWSHSISELGTLLESNINYLDLCNDSDLNSSTSNYCEYTINSSRLNIEDNFIHIFVNDSSIVNNKSTLNFSIDNVPILSNISVSNETTSSAIVNWNINELANGTVYVTKKIPDYPIIETDIDFDFENSTPGQCPEGWTCKNDSTTASSSNGYGCNIANNIQGTKYAKVGCNETIGTMNSDEFFLPKGISKVKFLMAGGADAGSGLYVKEGGPTDSSTGTQSNPGLSCLDILNGDSSKSNGTYWIDPDGTGNEDPFQVYCDMTTDGGGWTLVATVSNVDSSSEVWFMNGGSINNAIWTSETEFGDTTQLNKADAKSPAYWTLSGSNMLIYENVNSNLGKRKYKLNQNYTMKDLFNLPANSDVKISSTRIGTDTTDDYAFCDNDYLMVNYDLGNDGARLASRSKISECTSGLAARVDGGTGYSCKGDVSRNSATHYNTDSTISDHTVWIFMKEDGTVSQSLCSAENGTDTDTFYTMTCDNLENYENTSVHIELKDTENSSWGKLYIDNITFINTSGNVINSYQRNYTIPYTKYKNSSYRFNHSILLHNLGGNREYKYYVESYDNDLGPNRTTSLYGYFTLFNNPPNVTVIYPNNGEVMSSRYLTILWNASDMDNDDVNTVDIYYDNDDNKANGRTTISLDETNDGSYTWDLFGLPNGQYYISIDASSYDLANNVSVTVTDYTDQKFTRQDLLLNYSSNTYDVQVDKNNIPKVTLIKPTSNEIIDTATYNITFNTNDSDSDPLSAYIYYSNESNPEDKSNVIIEGLDLFDDSVCNVTGDIYNTTLPHLCSYSWNTSEIRDSNYSIIVEVSDSVYRGNDTLNKFILNNGPENFTINITNITQTTARVVWNTNKPTNATIFYSANCTVHISESGLMRISPELNNPSSEDWSNGAITSNDNSNIHGIWGHSPNDVFKIFDLIPHNKVIINSTYYAIDSWDGEWAYLYVDDNKIWEKQRPNYANCDGGWSTYSVGPAPWGGVRCKSDFQTIIDHSSDKLKVSYRTNIDSDSSDESWGFKTEVYINATPGDYSCDLFDKSALFDKNVTWDNIKQINIFKSNFNETLSDLIPNHKYFAYAKSCDKLNYCKKSPIINFKTAIEMQNNKSQFNVTLLYPNTGEFIHNYDYVNWTATDLASDEIKINIYYDNDLNALNGKTLLASNLENDGSEWIDFRGIPSGSYYILVEAYKTNISNNETVYYRDYSDVPFSKYSVNVSYTSNNYEVQIDTNEYPNVTIFKPEENGSYSNTTPINFNLSDANDDELAIIDIRYFGNTFRRPFNVSNPDPSVRYSQYPIKLIFDTKTLIDNYKLDQFGQKLTIMNSTGEIPYYVKPGTFNTNKTEIWFETDLSYAETKEFEIRYGSANRLHRPYEEPNWSNFKFGKNIILNKDVTPVTEDLPDYPATNSNDGDDTSSWRGLNNVPGVIDGHADSIEWIIYDLNQTYSVSLINYTLTGSGISKTFSTYSLDGSTFTTIVNDTYENLQYSAEHYFIPTDMRYFYVDVRSILAEPQFYELKLHEPILFNYTMGSERPLEGSILPEQILATDICTDDDFTTVTPNNCTYIFDTLNLDGKYHICINATDYLLYTYVCSDNFTITNYEEYPILIKDVENNKFVNIFNREYNLNQNFNDPDNQHMTYEPQFYNRELLCHFENESCLNLNDTIVNPNSSQNVSFASGVFNNSSVFNKTELIYSLNKVNTEGSIEMWINASDIITEQTLMEVYENSTNNTLFRVYINNSKINFNVQNSTLSEGISYNISSNEFFHFAGTYYLNKSTNNISMYINSILVNESSILNYTLVDDYNVVLGNSISSNKYFEGSIDEFRISNNVTNFDYNLNYSYINEYPPIRFNINQTSGRMSVYSSKSFRGKWDMKFIATDITNRSTLSNDVEFTIYLPANYSTYSGDTTLFNEVSDIKNVTNATVENNKGRIDWHNNIDAEGVNFDLIVNLSDNFVRVNSSAASTLNSSATVYLYNLSIDRSPDILVDYNDDGNFVACPLSICQVVDYNLSSGNVIFNVTEFTTYTIQSNYAPTLEIPNFDYITNNTPSLIDLWNYTDDNQDNMTNFTYTIINQSNSSLTNCTITSIHYISCTNPGENITGSNLVWVQVNDTELTDIDSFNITFDYNLERYTFFRSRNNLDTELNLIMKVQYYNSSSWEDVALIYFNHTNISTNEILDLSTIWNTNKWNTSNALTPSGTYRAYVAALDNENNTLINSDGSLLEDGYNFTVYDTIIPEVHLIKPLNAITSKYQVMNFSCDITDNWISNMTLEIWNSSNISIISNTTSLSGTSNSTTWNITLPYEDIFTWNCLGKDLNGNSAWSNEGNYTFEFVLDNIPPSVELMIPEDKQTVNGTNISFSFNSSDNNATVLNCSVFIDGTFNDTIIDIGVIGFYKTMTEGIHNWSVNCTDAYDNSNATSVNTFAIGCGLNKTLCQDGTCSNDCDTANGGNQSCINQNGICEFGEGCACNDCINQTTMCNLNTICNDNGEFCIPLPSCGNNILEQGEDCDTTNFAGKSCSSYGFDKGSLLCNNLCLINTSNCANNNEGNTGDEIECTYNSECADSDPCTIDTCALEKCYNTPLTCGSEEICSNGICIPIFINECESDSDCDDGDDCTSNYCSNGICKSNDIEDCEECIGDDCEEEKFSPKKSNAVACLNDTQVMDFNYEDVKDIVIKEGRTLVVNPLALTCEKGHEDLSLMIPDKYKDETVFLCHEGICNKLKHEKISSLTCKDNIISKYKRESEIYLPNISSIETDDTLKKLVVENPLNLNIKLMTKTINEPTNEFVRIIENPIVVDVGDVKTFNITLGYTETSSIDEGSLGIFVSDKNEWRYFDSFVNYKNNTVTAKISDYNKYLKDGKLTLAIIGSICDDCVDSKLENVYSTNSKNALVMVHGFGGSAGSFQSLVNDLSLTEEDLDLWTFSYPSTKDLDDISNEFNDLMTIDMVKYDNIFIVGHSLGGLVVQDALNKSKNNYINKINSVILLGSPNKGISLIDKFIKLIDFTINIKGNSNLFNINSEALKDIKKAKNYPRLENINYYVIAGTKPYKFEFGGLKFYSDKLLGINTKNDGLVTIESARDVGGEENLKLCENYWEVDVTHTDLERTETSRKLIKNIISRNLKTEGLDDMSYIDVSIDKCAKGDVIYATAALNENYNSEDPIGCEIEKKAKGASFLERFFKIIMWSIAIIALIIILIIMGFVLYEVPKHEKRVIEKSVVKKERNIGDRLKSLGKNVDNIEKKIKKIK